MPLTKSGRAAFHRTNNLKCLWVHMVFSSETFFHCYLSFNTIMVCSEDIALCSYLSSSGITHFQQYYAAVRLPVIHLYSFVHCHTYHLYIRMPSSDMETTGSPSWYNAIVQYGWLTTPLCRTKSHYCDKCTCWFPQSKLRHHTGLPWFRR